MTTINTIEDLIKLLDENPVWVETLRARLLTRELIELPEKLAQSAAANQRRDNPGGDVAVLKDDRADFETVVKGIRDDLRVLRRACARDSARREVVLIAFEFGFTLVRTLGLDDLLRLTKENDCDDIPANQIQSFCRADLVLEATDQRGEDCYMPVEVSYTVNEWDMARAIRNAGFLTRFTGRDSYPVVAGLRYDNRVEPGIKSGEALWYEMDASDMESE